MKRWITRIALGAVGVTALLALAVFGALQLGSVQRAIGAEIVAALDGEVRGTIEVREFVTVGLGEVHVRGFRVLDDDGTLVLSLDDVTMVPDLGAIFDRRIGISSAQATGGVFAFGQHGDGPLHLDHAFRSMPPAPGAERGEGFMVDLRDIAFTDLRVDMAVDSAPRSVFTVASGSISVSTDARGVPSVEFTIADARGELADTVLSFGIATAHGVFDGDAVERAVITADTRIDGNSVPMRMVLRDPGDGNLRIRLLVDPSRGGILGRIAVLGLTAMSIGADAFRVDIDEPAPSVM